VAVVLAVGLLAALNFRDDATGLLDWLLLKIEHPGPRHLQLQATLALADQTIEISRSIDCKPKFNRTGGGWFDRSPGWYPERFLVSEALADGSGVMIVVPRACNREKLPGDDYVPLVLWTDSASQPNVVEAYFDRLRLTSGRSRVRLISFGLSRLDGASSSPAPRSDFTDWINLYSEDPSPEGQITRLVTLGAVRIPLTDLPTDVQEEASGTAADVPFVALAPRAGSAAVVVDSIIGAASGEYDEAQRTEAPTRFIPLRPLAERGFYEVASSDNGIAYFVPEGDSRCGEAAAYCVRWQGEDLLLDSRPSHYFAVNSEFLYQFRFGATLVSRP
jgi:hypothetical protein